MLLEQEAVNVVVQNVTAFLGKASDFHLFS